MGATNFNTVGVGKTVDEAMTEAQGQARYWHGHGGYSGTIAEKHGFVEFRLPARVTAARFEHVVWAALDESWAAEGARSSGGKAPRTPNIAQLEGWLGTHAARTILEVVDDKWGPAVAVRLGATEARQHLPKTPTGKVKARYGAWYFFGMASC